MKASTTTLTKRVNSEDECRAPPGTSYQRDPLGPMAPAKSKPLTSRLGMKEDATLRVFGRYDAAPCLGREQTRRARGQRL